MSRKRFSLLLVVTVVAAALILFLPERADTPERAEDRLLLPDLAGQVNDVSFLRLRGAGGEVLATFRREQDQWRLEEMQSYPADWERLRTLLADLSQSTIAEVKTSNPELYPRLGVEDVSGEDAAGVLVEFDKATGLDSVIVGNAPTGRDGQYVRLAGSDTSLLIDRGLDVPEDPVQWLNRSIIDISRDEVVEVTISHPDGDQVSARRASADDENFDLQGVPDGREISSNWSVNALAGGLASLRLEQVAEDSDMDWSEATVFALLTADGMRVNGWLIEREGEFWIRLGASAYQAMDQKVESEDGEARKFAEALSERVIGINERVSGWAYRIQQYQFDTLTKRMEDLLKPVDTASG